MRAPWQRWTRTTSDGRRRHRPLHVCGSWSGAECLRRPSGATNESAAVAGDGKWTGADLATDDDDDGGDVGRRRGRRSAYRRWTEASSPTDSRKWSRLNSTTNLLWTEREVLERERSAPCRSGPFAVDTSRPGRRNLLPRTRGSRAAEGAAAERQRSSWVDRFHWR